jgi:predicted RNase H-like HicB family nuclease
MTNVDGGVTRTAGAEALIVLPMPCYDCIITGGAMKHLQKTVKAVLRPGDESGYVAECMEIAVVTQGRTIDETISNLREAVALQMEDENAADFGLQDKPILVVTMEIEPPYAEAS